MAHFLYKRILHSFMISSVFSLTTAFADDLPLTFSSSTPGGVPTTATYTPNRNMAGNTLSITPEKVVYYTKSIAVCPQSMWVGNTRAGVNFTIGDIVELQDDGTSPAPDTVGTRLRVTSVDSTGAITGAEVIRQGWTSDHLSGTGPEAWAEVIYSANPQVARPCYYVTSQDARALDTTRTVSDKFSEKLTPKDFGAVLDGSDSIRDANSLQTMIDHGQRYFDFSGKWPVDKSFNTAVSTDNKWTPSHSVHGDSLFFFLPDIQRADGYALLDVESVDPNTGHEGMASGNTDIYELLYNGGLHFESATTGGTYYGPKYTFEHTLNTADHPYYYPSGEYYDTVVTQITGHDTGRSGQLIDLKLHLDSSLTKGFDSQEQMIAFEGAFYGKNGHWNLVGGSGDMTGEPTGGGWVDTQWELDVSGTGPELNYCNETPHNANCGRQGLVWVPTSNGRFIGSYSLNTAYTAGFTENQQIGSSNKYQNYYDPNHSTHIKIPWRTYTSSSDTMDIGGIFHVYPQSGNDKIISKAETTTDVLPRQAIDYMTINAGGSGYAVNDTLTFGNSVPTITVTSVGSSGAITGISYNPDGPTWTSSPGTISPTATSGSGTGASISVTTLPVTFSVVDAPTSGGTGFAVGDTLTLKVGSTTNTYGEVTVSSVDTKGGITGYTFSPSYMPFTDDPSTETPTVTTSGSGTGAVVSLKATYGKYILPNTTPYISDGYFCGWQDNGSSFSAGKKYPVIYTDSHGGVHTFAQLLVNTVFGSGSIQRYGGVYTDVQGTVSSSIGTSLGHVQVTNPTVADSAYADLTLVDPLPKWLSVNAMTGSGYKPLDILTLSLADGTVVGTVRVNTIFAGANGQLDGNMVDIESTVDIPYDFQGVVYASGGSGSGAKFYVHTLPSVTCGMGCDAFQYWQPTYSRYTVGTTIYKTDSAGKSGVYTVTTAGTSGSVEPIWPTSGTVTDGTVVWTHTGTSNYKIGRVESGVPFNTFYNVDGTASGITKWQWSSEDLFEEGVTDYLARSGNGYYGTGIYTDALFTNAVLDFSKMTVTNPLAAQIRMVSNIAAIDFNGTGKLEDRNKAYLIRNATSEEDGASSFSGLNYYDNTFSTNASPLTLLSDHQETKIPGVLHIGYADADSNSSLFSGKYPISQYGMTHITGKTNTGSNDWVSAQSLAYWQLDKSKLQTNSSTGGRYGYTSDSTQVFLFDLGGSDIYTDLTISGSTHVATLGPKDTTKVLTAIQAETHTEGDKIWCHDCRSPSQATGEGTGRWITLDSKNEWRTEDGLLASN